MFWKYAANLQQNTHDYKSSLHLLHIFRTYFLKNTTEELLLRFTISVVHATASTRISFRSSNNKTIQQVRVLFFINDEFRKIFHTNIDPTQTFVQSFSQVFNTFIGKKNQAKAIQKVVVFMNSFWV